MEKKKEKKKKGNKKEVPSIELANCDWIVWLFYPHATPWISQEHSRYLSVPHRTPPPPFRCSCQRCKKDKHSPKLFSSDNNMDPGSVPVQQQMHDQINCKKESYRLSSTCGAPRNHTNVPPVDAQVWRQLHLSAVARCSDSYCILYKYMLWLADVCRPARTLNSPHCLYAVVIDGVCCESYYGGAFTIICTWGPDVSFAVCTGGALFPHSLYGIRSTWWAASTGANVRLVLQS